MAFSIAFVLTALSAVGALFSTARSQPRLPRAAGWLATLLPLLAAVLVLCGSLSVFVALMSVLTAWMIALPLLGTLRALITVRAGKSHG